MASYADAKRGHARILNILLLQITLQSDTDSLVPDEVERMRAERRQHLGFHVSVRTLDGHPGITIGPSDKDGLGLQSIVEVRCFEVRRKERSIGIHGGDGVVGVDMRRGG